MRTAPTTRRLSSPRLPRMTRIPRVENPNGLVSGREAMLAHLVEDAARTNPEQTGRARSIAARRTERGGDELLLAHRERSVQLPRRRLEARDGIERRRGVPGAGGLRRPRAARQLLPELGWQVAQSQLLAVPGRDDRAPDHVLQLPDVARQIDLAKGVDEFAAREHAPAPSAAALRD